MGVLSLSFLWGDSINRLFLGLLIERGLGWRGTFAVAGLVMLAILIVNAIFLKEAPREVGLDEPADPPSDVLSDRGRDSSASGPMGVALGLMKRPAFALVCLLSLGLTLVRESFNTWSATYFAEGVGLPPGESARLSAVFPLFGGASVLLAGHASDRLGRGGRAALMVVALIAAAAALGGLGLLDPKGPKAAPIALVSLVGLLIIGPYSYLAGAMALDLGGKRGAASASALIDFVGYLGGALAGSAVAGVSVRHGWSGVFGRLAAVALASAVAAAWLWFIQRRAIPRPAP